MVNLVPEMPSEDNEEQEKGLCCGFCNDDDDRCDCDEQALASCTCPPGYDYGDDDSDEHWDPDDWDF